MKIARTSLNFGIHCDRDKYYSIRDKRWHVNIPNLTQVYIYYIKNYYR